MTEDDEMRFKLMDKCHICGEKYTDKDVRVRDHCHITGKFRDSAHQGCNLNRKNDLVLIMTPEKQDKILELSKHWFVDSTPARNEVIMKRTYPVKSVKCDKICSIY